jgi:NitT/TauT family transport system substrate-binding protein
MTALKKVDAEVSGVIFSIPWLVARDEGLFAEEGLDVNLVWSTSGDISTEEPIENPEDVQAIVGHDAFEEGKVCIYRA